VVELVPVVVVEDALGVLLEEVLGVVLAEVPDDPPVDEPPVEPSNDGLEESGEDESAAASCRCSASHAAIFG